LRLHAKDDPEHTAHVIEELKISLEQLNQGKDPDHIKITSQEFIQLLIEHKEFGQLLSPFNIEQPHSQSK
jgi:hypothetical protein